MQFSYTNKGWANTFGKKLQNLYTKRKHFMQFIFNLNQRKHSKSSQLAFTYRNTRTMREIYSKLTIRAPLIFSKFHTLLYCFYGWLWTDKFGSVCPNKMNVSQTNLSLVVFSVLSWTCQRCSRKCAAMDFFISSNITEQMVPFFAFSSMYNR